MLDLDLRYHCGNFKIKVISGIARTALRSLTFRYIYRYRVRPVGILRRLENNGTEFFLTLYSNCISLQPDCVNLKKF